MARILVVDDEPNTRSTLARILARRGYAVSEAPDGAAALEVLAAEPIDVVLTDLKMPNVDGMDLLAACRERGHDPSVIVLTGYGTIQNAVEAMRLGATDYLIKPANPDELLLIIRREMESRRLRLENRLLQAERRRDGAYGELLGDSRPMRRVADLVGAVSRNRSNVLLAGESGTGKELVARTIHEKSRSAEAPFLAVNCVGKSETLIDSQLFGHRPGSFPGAVGDHDGVFRAASGGTLFLDEVLELPVSLQAKFLRTIEDREVTPIGSTRAVPVDVRIIAATSHDLQSAVKSGRLRSDLYYRLNVVTIHLPPLRERLDDLGTLIDHFIHTYARDYGVEPKRVTNDAIRLLERYHWPGNVRELQNTIERAFALSPSPEISVADLPASIREPELLDGDGVPVRAPRRLEDLERNAITEALRATNGNKSRAAHLLGIDRQRLYRKIAKYRL